MDNFQTTKVDPTKASPNQIETLCKLFRWSERRKFAEWAKDNLPRNTARDLVGLVIGWRYDDESRDPKVAALFKQARIKLQEVGYIATCRVCMKPVQVPMTEDTCSC